MKGELSEGLPGLVTSGNRILHGDSGQQILLRGVNRSGLEYSWPSAAGFLDGAGLSLEEIQHIASVWRCNVIRLPFNQEFALRGRNGHSAEEYLTAIDQVVSWAAACGVYTILDLQWLDVETIYGHTKDGSGVSVENHVPPLPNAETILLWETLAVRYREEPAVLFDLLNEPHSRLKDDENSLWLVDANGGVIESTSGKVGAREWRAWAAHLTARVRQLGCACLILVSGVDWAFDLRGMRMDGADLVYSAHVYPNRKRFTWWKAFDGCGEMPVFVGEWGGTDGDLQFGRRLAEMMRARVLGWAAWSWADHPHLLKQPRVPHYEPTAFGELVRSELQRDAV